MLGTLVRQADLKALVQERHLLEPRAQGFEVEVGRLEDLVVGPEGDRGSRAVGVLVARERRLGDPVAVGLPPHASLAADLDVQGGRQGVDDRDADAVQTSRDRVAGPAELPTGVQHRQDDLDRRSALARDDIDRDAAPVVDDPYPTVGLEGDLDVIAVARQGLVDRVVHDFVDQVVKPPLARRADVHAWPLTDGFEAFEDGDGAGVVSTIVGKAGGGALFSHGSWYSSSSRTRSEGLRQDGSPQHAGNLGASAPRKTFTVYLSERLGRSRWREHAQRAPRGHP